MLKINLWESCKSAGKNAHVSFTVSLKKSLCSKFVGHKTLIYVENESTHKKVTKNQCISKFSQLEPRLVFHLMNIYCMLQIPV